MQTGAEYDVAAARDPSAWCVASALKRCTTLCALSYGISLDISIPARY